jgi:hypothetical protein
MAVAEPKASPSRFDFRPSMRQRRLRVLAAAVLLTIIAMVITGVTNSFFRSPGDPQVQELAREAIAARREHRQPSPEAERARQAVTTRLTFIGGYWAVCLGLSCLLVLLAWLDVREIRRRLLAAQLGVLRSITRRPPKPGSNGHH